MNGGGKSGIATEKSKVEFQTEVGAKSSALAESKIAVVLFEDSRGRKERDEPNLS